MLSNICFALFGPSLTYDLKSLQFIQELSHVVLQLVPVWGCDEKKCDLETCI